jgi:TolB-like protein/DNA-binding winged helix-turn-helix (wHTH) protein/tetratricopeptide (TPR) repeat protein
MEARPSNRIRFDAWTLDTQSGDLAKGEVTTRLQIQPLQVLLALLEDPGNLVTREQLIARLWPKGIVEFDTSLNTAVRKLRIALNDDSDNPRYIETIPRRGYRFIAKLDPPQEVAPPAPVTPAPPPPKSRTRYIVLAAALLFVIAAAGLWFWRADAPVEIPSVVVLPFVDMGTEQKDAVLCLRIPEEIGNRLGQFSNVRVVSRTSAIGYQGKNADVREIGKKLGAMYVVEGSVRRDVDALRITVRLVNAEDGYHLYSQLFDFPSPDSIEVEQSLSQSVAQALRLWLSPALVRQWQARGSDSREAFGYFARGHTYGHEGTSDGDAQAEELYRLAIERDPRFALAYVGLAEVALSTISTRELKIVDVKDEVAGFLATAEKLNPDMPELVAAKAWFAIERRAYDEAEKLLLDAIARNPGDALVNGRLADLYSSRGRPRDALARYTRAAELDPMSFYYPMYRCMMLQDLGQNDEAARACARTRMLNRDNYWVPFVTSWLEYGRGDLLEALRLSTEAAKLAPGEGGPAFARIEYMLALRLVEQSRAALRQIVTTDDARVQLMRANVELAEHGPAGLRAYLDDSGKAALSSPLVGVDAMRLYHIAGDLENARQALDALRAAPGYTELDLYDAMQVRVGFSPALVCAAVLLETDDRAEGLRLLEKLDAFLTSLEQSGWANHGLDSIRAESLALRGQPDAAMRSLQRAVARGWRTAWSAQTAPYLSSLWEREDFKSLMKEVEARNAEMRARFLQINAQATSARERQHSPR